ERKTISINEYHETSIDNVFAIGDVIGKAMLAHSAYKAGIVVANRIAKKLNLKGAEDVVMDFDKIPSCIYTSPEIAMIGKTEKQLKESNTEYKAFKFPFAAVGKALTDESPTGFVKLIIEPKHKTVIGAHIIGGRATDMISEIGVLIEAEGTVSELASTIHSHPTFSEAVGEAAEALD